MELKIFLLFVLLVGLSCQRQSGTDTSSNSLVIGSSNYCVALNGKIYTYLPRSGIERHLFTLRFECDNDTLKGLLFAPFPMGEHGLAFYKTELKELIIDDSLNFSFFIIPGELYEAQITQENYKRSFKSLGIDRGEQFFKGKLLSDNSIVLQCKSEFNDCYSSEEMIFKLNK